MDNHIFTKVAYFISLITHPVFLFFYTFIYLLFMTDLFAGIVQVYNIWLIFAYLVLNSIVIPLGLIYFFERKFNIIDKSKRQLPYFILIFFYFLIYLFFRNFMFPDIIKKFILSILLGLVVLFFLNFIFKISMHTTSAGAVISLFLYLYFNNTAFFFTPLIFVFILTGLIGTCRLLLKAHSGFEIYIGYLAGFVITSTVLIL